MKKSVLFVAMVLTISNSTFAATKRVLVKGQGKSTGYFEPNDEVSFYLTKKVAKREADKVADEKCKQLHGEPLWELAGYTSTCKADPKFPGEPPKKGYWYWYRCTVTVALDCEVPK